MTKALNEITGTDEVHIKGEKIGIDTENANEHVVLLKEDGSVAAVAKNGGDCEIVVTIDGETHSVHSVVCDAPDIPPEPPPRSRRKASRTHIQQI